MSAENESKPTPGDEQAAEPDGGAQPSQQTKASEEHHAYAQAQRDEEIEAIQQHSRHQPPGIQKPPELPPAPPRKALTLVGMAAGAAGAGGLTLWSHMSHERALAKETERRPCRPSPWFIPGGKTRRRLGSARLAAGL
jgi:ferric-dicitrate binding protein FerR (iron transport regulator)